LEKEHGRKKAEWEDELRAFELLKATQKQGET
jgi:hypothetical protein